MSSVTRLHVVALQGARPDAVVADHPLGARRVVRCDLLEQVGAVAELGLQVLDQHQAHEVVHRAHRFAVRRPFGIDAEVGKPAVAHAPEDPEPVPLAVRRHVRVEPLQAVGDRVVVVGRRPHPRGRALEHGELADLGRDLGDELHRARAGADDPDALAAKVDVVVPASRVERRSFEQVASRDVRELRPVELADRADDGVRRASSRAPAGPRTSTVQVSVASSQVADSTSVLKWMCSRSSNASAQLRK